MPTRPPFPESYDAVSVPETIYLEGEESSDVSDIANRFFDKIEASLQLGYLAIQTFCKVRVRTVRLPSGELKYSQKLRFVGAQSLARVVVEIHDNEARTTVGFEKYSLSPRTIETIHDIDKTMDMVDHIHRE